MRGQLRVLLLALLFAPCAWAFPPFVVEDIELEGLQRISAGTLFNYLPIRVGDRVTEERTAEAIRALFATGFFEDVELGRRGDTLVVAVKERPSVAEISLSGNRDITSEQLTEALKQIGLAQGRTFDRSLLDKVEQELKRQYFSRGKYGVQVRSEVKPLPRNRVELAITITEGAVAKIATIDIVGNEAFSDDTLRQQLQLGTFSLFGSNDQYSRQKLAADLETLKSYYLDRGYINFDIQSTQVSITPDKRQVYIVINIAEGEKYNVTGVNLAGDLIVPEEELRALIGINAGDVFSRKAVAESSQAISERLGEEGYAFANINPVPDVNRQAREVALTFFVDPGKRIYVRRINIMGNTRTQDEVLRRELRQMERAWLDTRKVNRSRIRLQRLGFFEEVNVETPPVPGIEDQVDLNVSVVERSSGTLQAGVGYSESQGLLFTASVSHSNFLGTGKRVSAEINNSDVNTIYSFSYTNPYYTLDGISRGFRGFYRQTDSGQRNTADYNADTYGAAVDYGIPLSETNSLSLGIGYEHTKINPTPSTPRAYSAFLDTNTDEFDAFKLSAGWSYDTRNRAIFPEEGVLHSLTSEVALPGSGIQYYKINHRSQWYRPLTDNLIMMLNGQLGFGEGYGDTTALPFFEHFYAGGGRTVRGFASNTLGPKEDGEPLGGSFKVAGNAELIFPTPLDPESRSVRTSAFFDVGNVFGGKDDYATSELRYSVGVSAVWLSPIGPMVFSLAKALNPEDGDETETFQFTLGAGF